jgi:hypothetical protein
MIEIARALPEAAERAKVPGVLKTNTSVVLGGENIIHGDRMLIIEVHGLFDDPIRTPEARMRLASELATEAALRLPIGWSVEVLVYRFNPDVDGFANVLRSEESAESDRLEG